MPRSTSPRMYLADLMTATTVCALALALFTSVDSPVGEVGILLLMFELPLCWWLFRSSRRGPICEECGHRFLHVESRPMPAGCPHCGREQIRRARSIRRMRRVFWGLVGLVPVLLAVAAGLVSGLKGGPHESARMIGGAIAVLMVVPSLLAMIGVVVYRSRLLRPRDRACEACGKAIDEQDEVLKVCPHCRVRHLRAEEARRGQVVGLGSWGVCLLTAAIFVAFAIRPPGGFLAACPPWLGFPLAVLGLMVLGALGWYLFLYLRLYLRILRLRSNRGAIAMARECAREEGEVVDEGGLTAWYSGPSDPGPMLREQADAARRAFEAMTGLEAGSARLHFLIFHDRGAFLRFHQPFSYGMDLASHDGFYLWYARRLVTVCTAPAARRVSDPERTARSMVAFALLEAAWGRCPPAWLQTGLAWAVMTADDPGASVRLNRKMIASLSCGAALSGEIFGMTPRDLGRLMQGSRDPVRSHRLQQFAYQSASIAGFLLREDPPKGEPGALGAFLIDRLARRRPEEAFVRHFGRGFAPLLEDWRRWVLDRGIGPYEPPSPHVREAMLGRVLPVIRDAGSRPADRILAIRSWAGEGYVMSADVLIDLLDDPGEIPKEEVVWALRMASGMAWGDEPDRWRAWWDELPMEWQATSELIAGGSSE